MEEYTDIICLSFVVLVLLPLAIAEYVSFKITEKRIQEREKFKEDEDEVN